MNAISPKVGASAITGAALTLILFAAAQAGIEVPAVVQGAIVTLLSAVAGYLKTDPLRGSGKRVAGRN